MKLDGIVRRKIRRRVSKRDLVQTSEVEAFWVHQGPILRNLRDLSGALEHEITDKQFDHHVHDGRNDFATWIREVLHDTECSRSVSRTCTRAGAAEAILECLRIYK